jgi:DegV family protein with EDD domain
VTVRVVTDSTADLPPEVVRELAITVVPLLVLFGDEVYRDGVDLTNEEFFKRLTTSPVLPTTSQPSVGAFQETYRELAATADQIVSIHISAWASGTCDSALQAASSLGGSPRVEVVDSRTTSMGLGFQVIAAARAAQAGASMEEVAAAARSVGGRHHLLALLETLEYLRRGGRIGRAQAFLGSILNLKPLLTFRDGVVHPVARVRTRARALEELLRHSLAYGDLEDVAVIHGTTPEDADMLARRVRERLPQVPIHVGRLGPVLGVHGGPGIIGMVVVEAEKAGGDPHSTRRGAG